MRYFILYKDNHYTEFDAENLEDCFIQVADYTDDNTDLFRKALQGCHSPEDYVDMYEQFSQNRIDGVLLIAQTIYERGVTND